MTDKDRIENAIRHIKTAVDVDPWAMEIAVDAMRRMLSEQPEWKMSNNEWIDFLVSQFDVSRTSAREMLHGMMRWKKEDNFKKQFNGRRRDD